MGLEVISRQGMATYLRKYVLFQAAFMVIYSTNSNLED